MKTKKEILAIFEGFLKQEGLQCTKQREEILNVFYDAKKHLSVEELYYIVKKKDSKIGQTTVFRTLKLLCEADIAREVDLGDRIIRYEVKIGNNHHDHLVCTKCGKLIEAVDPEIERLQEKLCRKFGFTSKKHRLEIFGLCKKCKDK
jgi:Fur family ferric uptake transcriptional regulator